MSADGIGLSGLRLDPAVKPQRFGQGPSLVLLPSPLIMAHLYRPLARRLGRHFKVFVPELPESGFNKSALHTWTNEDHAKWVLSYLDQHGIRKATLVGHSTSGPVAAFLAARFPERIRGLVLVSCAGLPGRTPGQILTGRTKDLFLEPGFSLRAAPALIFNALVHRRNFFRHLAQSVQSDMISFASNIRVPTLLAWGRRDHTTPFHRARPLIEALPHAEIYLSRRGSHDWLLTNQAEFIQVLRRWSLNLPTEKPIKDEPFELSP